MILPDNILKCMAKEDRASLGKAGRTNAEIDTSIAIKCERELQSQVIGFLRVRSVRQVLTPKFGKKTTIKAGWPDITFSYNGLPCVWEIKLPGGKLSEEQQKVSSELRADGWMWACIRSIQEAKDVLDGYDLFLKSLK